VRAYLLLADAIERDRLAQVAEASLAAAADRLTGDAATGAQTVTSRLQLVRALSRLILTVVASLVGGGYFR
jgi:hypothetical protein